MKNPFKKPPEYRPPGHPHFTLQKFPEKASRPIESEWSIRLLWTKHEIYCCNITLNSVNGINGQTVTPLPWWDKNTPYYQRFILAGGSVNARIPHNYKPNPDDSIHIYDGETLLCRATWQQIIEVEK